MCTNNEKKIKGLLKKGRFDEASEKILLLPTATRTKYMKQLVLLRIETVS